MCITEYDEERTMAEKVSEGIEIGVVKGEQKHAVSGAIRMIKRGKDTLEEIAEIMDLPLEEVIALSKQIKAMPV